MSISKERWNEHMEILLSILIPMLVGMIILLLFLGLIYAWANYPEYVIVGLCAILFLALSWFVGVVILGWIIEIFNL